MKENLASPITIYYCGRETCSPGYSFGPAVRQHYLLHVVLKGRGRFQTASHLYQLQAGEAFLIPPGELTYYEAHRQDPWEYAWVGLDGWEVPEILRKCGLLNGRYVYTPSDPQPYMNAATHLVESFQNGAYNKYQLLAHLYMMFSYMTDKEHNSKDSDASYVHKAKTYISQNYAYQIHITDIAGYVGIDRTYLFKLFKAAENMSPKDYLIWFRVRAAMKMLTETSYTVAEIAFSCGFSDTPSFCKQFKKRTGASPLQFRKRSSDIILPF